VAIARTNLMRLMVRYLLLSKGIVYYGVVHDPRVQTLLGVIIRSMRESAIGNSS